MVKFGISIIFLLLSIHQNLLSQTKLDYLSLVTTPIKLLKGDTIVAQGTGFYFETIDSVQKNSIVFLITNVHVLTGYAPQKKHTPLGDNIIFYFHKNENDLGNIKEIRFPIFTKKLKPIWLVSKEYPDADIAIIPLPIYLYKDIVPFVVTEDFTKQEIFLQPTSPVTLIGYPYGYYDTINSLPIYKTGNLACEPKIDFNGKPLLLIDISAFPGMSGSPVFAIASGAYKIREHASGVGTIRKFLGIYASMEIINKKKYLEEFDSKSKEGIIISESLQLGHVWKASLIIKIIKDIDVVKYEKEILKDL